jgi:hypothetical protein
MDLRTIIHYSPHLSKLLLALLAVRILIRMKPQSKLFICLLNRIIWIRLVYPENSIKIFLSARPSLSSGFIKPVFPSFEKSDADQYGENLRGISILFVAESGMR